MLIKAASIILKKLEIFTAFPLVCQLLIDIKRLRQCINQIFWYATFCQRYFRVLFLGVMAGLKLTGA